jgi:hypothetical protein
VNDFPLPAMGNRTCALRAFGVARATSEAVPALRKQPGPPPGRTLPGNLLHHADDQTVVAVSAVLNAIDEFGLQGEDFKDWGVVGAPHFPGRQFFANALNKFARTGALGVSPIIVPFLSLHAVSSMISLALRIHGPAIGVGGGSDSFSQALLMGLSLQQEHDLPGVWVVTTGYDPEPFADSSADAPPPVCQAAALALLPARAGANGTGGLRLVASGEATASIGPSTNLSDLMRILSTASAPGQSRSLRCVLPGDHTLELTATAPQAGISLLAKSA